MKKDNIAKETHYKCVAIYGNVTVQKEFTITNFDSIYEITIQSDEGAQFYHDNGKPSLTCLINGKEETSDEYTYIWSKIDSNNRFSMLSETTDANIAYNAAVATKEQLLAEIAAESKLTGEIQETLNECNATIEYYDSRTRIEQNKVHNINLKEITSYAIYKCAVFRHDVSLGVTTFKIVNDLTTNISYNLVINNGNQVFKYNEAGVAPNSSSAIEPVDILPLTFTLYDKDGKEVDKSLIGLSNISWKAPLQHTMIEETDLYEIKEETDDYVEYYKTQTFDFNIRPSYVSTHKNNNIQLIVKYKDNIITATTDFTFIKTGEAGTNGTEYICKILPNSIDVQDICPIVTYDTLSEEYSLNYRTVEDGQWFKINFWKNGELIYSNTSSGYTKEGQAIQLEWSILANNYGNDFQDNSNFNIDKETGIVSFNKENYDHPANIIKCKITYNNLEYFAIMPIILVRTTNDKYQISLENKTGFQEAMYTANGTNPVYNESKPFTIQVLEHINGNWEDVSLLEQNYAVDYDWSVKGQVYYSYWHSEQNLLEKSMYLLQEQRNQKYFEPADTFNGLCVNNAVECVISREEETLGSIHIPVYLYLNRYGNSAINGWDGNSISIDENNSGMILAPQVGAGKKNADNSFTGIFMGSVKEQGAPTEEHGLFGYNAGQRTIALNAEDGSARFGATGKGQIIIDPSTGNAMIESGNFNTEAGTGMRIDLSEPSIEFGSGNFKVDKYGQLTAAGFSTIDYVNKKKDEIIQEVEGMLDQSPLSVVLSTENLFVPCDDENVPVNAATYNVDFAGTFEGESIEPGQLEVLYAGKDDDNTDGFPVVVDSVTVTLTNNSDKQQLHFAVQNEGIIDDIALATNTYFRFNFFYTNGEQTHTITKTISMTVLPPGAPGKSAYDIWLDQGNVGTEEDYLNSLKGQSAQLSSFETERTISGYGTQLLGNSGNHEIPILTLYGNAEQDVEYTKNLLKGFQEPVSNTYYWSFGSNLQVENLENGWGRIILDNSAGTSTLTNGFQMGLNNLINWKYKTKYTVIVEIRNSSMTSNSSVFYPIGNGGSAVHCFDDDSWRLTNTQINNGGVYSWKGTTIDSGYSWEYLRGSLSAAPGAISTIEIRYSMYEGDFELGDTFEYIPCQCLYPTIDNPKIIKTASYTNIFDSEKWYQECFSIDSSSISKVTVDNREAYKVRPSGLVDFLFMENEFEEKTQYHLSFEGRQVSTSGTTMRVEFRYTDGTISSVNVPTSKTTFSTVSISSTAGKTIQGIGINSNEDKLSTFVYIRYFLLTKGPGKKDYLPYNQNVLSIITNVRNIVNIYELIPDVRINGKTGEEMSYGGYVVSPFIKLENIASFSKSYLLHNFAYYDQNFKYLGYGEQLLKDTAYIPASNKTSNNIIPYHLNPNITYVRVAYTGNGVTAATTWLKEALAANSLNHSSLTIRAQTTSTGITTGSDTGGVKATKHAIQLNQPFARVANPIERKPSVARDTVTIEDEIAQISYATKFIK